MHPRILARMHNSASQARLTASLDAPVAQMQRMMTWQVDSMKAFAIDQPPPPLTAEIAKFVEAQARPLPCSPFWFS
jgi:hypothetical protein